MAKKNVVQIPMVPYDPWTEIKENIDEYDDKLREFGLWNADEDCKAITPHGDSITCEFPGEEDEYADTRTDESIAMPKKY